jgi:hypothetical protein
MMTVAVLVHRLFSNGSAPMVRFAERHHHARITAQRQGREQKGEQNDPAGAFHGGNPSTGISH